MTQAAIALKAASREETRKKIKRLKKQGKIPAVLYGHKIKPKNLWLDWTEFEKAYKLAGESTLIDLAVDQAKPVKVLIQDCQADPLTNQFNHVDFHQVRMDEKIHTEISLKFSGEAPVVKELGGILVTNIHALAVTCLPQDLVHEIEVDLSSLKGLADVIHVSDIKLPPGLTVKAAANEAVVLIQPPRAEEELAGLAAKPEEVLPAGAKEETAPAEGEAIKPEKNESGKSQKE